MRMEIATFHGLIIHIAAIDRFIVSVDGSIRLRRGKTFRILLGSGSWKTSNDRRSHSKSKEIIDKTNSKNVNEESLCFGTRRKRTRRADISSKVLKLFRALYARKGISTTGRARERSRMYF
jgi:hypothetical protein